MRTKPLDQIKIEVVSIGGGDNISNQFRVYGVMCKDPLIDAKERELKVRNELGLRKQLPKEVSFYCNDDLSTMTSEFKNINCIEPCTYNTEIVPPDFVEPVTGLFTMHSYPCVAAIYFYGEKAGTKFGIARKPNDKIEVNGTMPPFLFSFDASLVSTETIFAPNEEIDVLDPNEC